MAQRLCVARGGLQAGRCGRVAPGTCVRLYSKDFYECVMPPFDPPGIQRLPLENLLLRVLSLREPLGMSATELLQRVCIKAHMLGAGPRQCSSLFKRSVSSWPHCIDAATAVSAPHQGSIQAAVRDGRNDLHR